MCGMMTDRLCALCSTMVNAASMRRGGGGVEWLGETISMWTVYVKGYAMLVKPTHNCK